MAGPNHFDQFDDQPATTNVAPGNPSKVIKDRNAASASNFDPTIAAAEARIKDAEARVALAKTQAERDKAIADAEKARSEADKARLDANSGSAKAATTVRADAITGYNTSQQLMRIIDGLNEKFMAGPGKTSGIAGARDYLPLTVNKQFDTAGNASRGIVGQALAFTGGQLNTPREAEQAIGPFLPQAGDRDEVIRDKIARLTDLAKTAEQRSMQILGGRPDPNGNIIPVDAQPAKASPPSAIPGEQLTLANGPTRTEIDPMRQAVMARVSQMVVQGRPRSDVEKFIRDNEMSPNEANLTKLYNYRASPDFKEWQRKNPGASLPLDPKYYTREVPMSQIRQDFNKGAASGPGGAIDSYLANAAGSLSGNHLDDLAGEQANTGMDLLRQQHPGFALAGDASGQVMFDLLASKVPGLRALPSKRFGQAGMDAIYGGYSGQGEGDTLGGMLSNVGGGMLGRGVAKLGGAALRGVSSPSLSYLNSRDVPLTIGQIGRGSGTVAGNVVSGIEDRMAGLPLADAVINSARRRGEQGVNAAAFREAGGSGVFGSKGIGELGDKVNNAYSFLDGTNLPVDAAFVGSLAGVRAGLPNLPAFGGEIGKGLDQIDRLGPVIPGRDWQSALRSTKANRSSIAGQPFSDGATSALGDVQDNLLTLAERQGPPGTVDSLTNANRLNGQYQTLLGALDNGPSQARGEMFSTSRLDAASRQGARNFGGRAASMRGERPFYDLTTAGMDVMPNQVPDSGTAGRSLLYAALLPSLLGGGAGAAYGGLSDNSTVGEGAAGGAAIGAGTVLPAAILGGLYSKAGQRGVQRMLLAPRGPATQKAADIIGGLNMQRALGPTASALLRKLYLYDPLPPQGN